MRYSTFAQPPDRAVGAKRKWNAMKNVNSGEFDIIYRRRLPAVAGHSPYNTFSVHYCVCDFSCFVSWSLHAMQERFKEACKREPHCTQPFLYWIERAGRYFSRRIISCQTVLHPSSVQHRAFLLGLLPFWNNDFVFPHITRIWLLSIEFRLRNYPFSMPTSWSPNRYEQYS